MIEVDEKKLDAVLNNSLISCLGISSDYFHDRTCQEYSPEVKHFRVHCVALRISRALKNGLKRSDQYAKRRKV